MAGFGCPPRDTRGDAQKRSQLFAPAHHLRAITGNGGTSTPGDGLQRCCRAFTPVSILCHATRCREPSGRYLDLVSCAMVSSARYISFPTIAAYRMICSAVFATSTHSDADSGLSSPSRRTLRIAFAACSAVALELTFIGRSSSMLRRNPSNERREDWQVDDEHDGRCEHVVSVALLRL